MWAVPQNTNHSYVMLLITSFALQVQQAVQSLIDQHQQIPGNILRALLERFHTKHKDHWHREYKLSSVWPKQRSVTLAQMAAVCTGLVKYLLSSLHAPKHHWLQLLRFLLHTRSLYRTHLICILVYIDSLFHLLIPKTNLFKDRLSEVVLLDLTIIIPQKTLNEKRIIFPIHTSKIQYLIYCVLISLSSWSTIS